MLIDEDVKIAKDPIGNKEKAVIFCLALIK